jgi:hypothetical protein
MITFSSIQFFFDLPSMVNLYTFLFAEVVLFFIFIPLVCWRRPWLEPFQSRERRCVMMVVKSRRSRRSRMWRHVRVISLKKKRRCQIHKEQLNRDHLLTCVLYEKTDQDKYTIKSSKDRTEQKPQPERGMVVRLVSKYIYY